MGWHTASCRPLPPPARLGCLRPCGREPVTAATPWLCSDSLPDLALSTSIHSPWRRACLGRCRARQRHGHGTGAGSWGSEVCSVQTWGGGGAYSQRLKSRMCTQNEIHCCLTEDAAPVVPLPVHSLRFMPVSCMLTRRRCRMARDTVCLSATLIKHYQLNTAGAWENCPDGRPGRRAAFAGCP